MYSAIGEGDDLSSSISTQLFSFFQIQSELIIGKGRSGKVYTGGTHVQLQMRVLCGLDHLHKKVNCC